MDRRTFFVWHSWIGLTTGLLMFVICWSGTVAVFSRELDRLSDPRLSAPAAERVNWQAIQENAQAAFPGWTLTQINAPPHTGLAAETWAEDQEGVLRRIYSDPGTGEVLGSTSYFNVQRFFRSLHMSLFVGELPVLGIPLGYLIVGLLSLPLLASGVTSLVFYKRFWRGFFRLHLGKGAKVFWSDIHKLTGLWSLWFLVVIGLTSLWYLIEWKAPDGPPAPSPPAVVSRGLPLSHLVAAAQRAYPELDVRVVALHSHSEGVIEAQGQDGSILVRDRAARSWVNAGDALSLGIQRVRDLSLYERWIDTADPLHFGDFGGLWSKSIWFAFGLALSALCLTGAYLQAKRQQRRRPTSYRPAVLIAYGITIAVLLLSVVFGFREIGTYGPSAAAQLLPLQLAVIIAWVASTFIALTLWVRAVR